MHFLHKLISIEECRKTLGPKAENLSAEKIQELRQVLYQLASLDYQIFKNTEE